MEHKFEEGDVVELKSGGPAMTFTGISQLGEAICVWFEKNQQRSGTFPLASLKPRGPTTYSATISRA